MSRRMDMKCSLPGCGPAHVGPAFLREAVLAIN